MEKDEARIPVAVLQGSYPVELAVARSLGKYDIPVFILTRGKAKPASSFSKFVKGIVFNPDPLVHEKDFIHSLLNFGEKLKRKYQRRILLLPTDDGSLLLLAENFDSLKRYFVILNDVREKGTLRFSEKIHFFQTLQNSDCRNFLPLTLFCRSRDDIESIKNKITFPCVIKPSKKDINFSFYRRYNSKVLLVESEDDLEKKLIQLLAGNQGLLVQELVSQKSGREVSWYGYRAKSGKILGMTARQIRKRPQIGGTATMIQAEEIPKIHTYVSKALISLDFWGIGEMEFMLDERKEEYKVIEFNPRCWLQLSLATKAGLNLPYLCYREVYRNEWWTPIINKKRKARWVWVKEDFLRAVVGDKTEGVLKNLFRWIPQISGDCTYAIHSFADPKLTLNRFLRAPGKLLKRILKP